MENGSLLTLAAVGAVAAVGAANKAGFYGSNNEGSSATRLSEVGYKKVRATGEESRGMYNDPVVIQVDGKRIVTSAGRDDELEVYRYGDNLFVVNMNRRMPYFGGILYTENNGQWQHDDEIFLDNDWEIEETLGKNYDSLSGRTIANRLLAAMS